jgi:FHS family L-fucose permease-like MFS transporter
MQITSTTNQIVEEQDKGRVIPRHFKLAFILVTSLFFLWAIAHNMNDILIRQFQKALDLSRGEASFIQISFYLAYFFAAIPAGILMKKLGFKKTIIIGLTLYAIGAALFYPAAEVRSYGFFLVALFILASGIVFLETSGSGYITLVGDPATSARRINFSQSFNGVGAITAPLIGGLFIFSGVEHSPEQLAALSTEALNSYRIAEAQQVQMPYVIISAVLICLALAIAFTRFPSVNFAKKKVSSTPFLTIFQHKSFVGALVGQFFYVGAQIGIWSYFIDFAIELTPDTTEKMAAYYLSASLFTFMLGRFVGTYLMKFINPRALMARYTLICIALVIIATLAPGMVAVIALAITSFFMSIMFPTIYALGLEKIGDKAEIGSSLIIMTIISGALIPPLMGYLADNFNVQWSYVVPLVCFIVVWLATKFGKE